MAKQCGNGNNNVDQPNRVKTEIYSAKSVCIGFVVGFVLTTTIKKTGGGLRFELYDDELNYSQF